LANKGKPIIDAPRLEELLAKLEDFRKKENLSTGDFQFLMETNVNCLTMLHNQVIGVKKSIGQEVEERYDEDGAPGVN